ncbi:protein SMG9-like isoform X1 [Thrips palmi]|uniref:Protein SMG9-like isoform X1 n=1 Tax=Thrips palmi TaxID=161013 RepID=A0A6P9ACY3_THRPL|nr:protein SMG9-like isoform X1 [Thrips palmi]
MGDRKIMKQDEGAIGRRPPVLLVKNDHDTLEKPPTIILRTREGENRAVSPSQTRTPIVLKKETSDSPAQPSYQLAYKASAAPQVANPLAPSPKMKSSVKLIDETMQFCDVPTDSFMDQNDFLVVGILGQQSVGKSTVLSLLASGNPAQPLRDMCFKPQDYEQAINATHCTSGVDLYVTTNRMLLLDTQPLMSASVFERISDLDGSSSSSVPSTKKYPGSSAPSSSSGPSIGDVGLLTNMDGALEIHSLQMAAFVLSVCHVVILVQDWFFDPDMIRLIQSAEMLKPPTPTTAADETLVEYFPHLFLLHNQCKPSEFTPDHIKMMQSVYRDSFIKSKLDIKSGVGVGMGGIIDFVDTEACGEPINLFLLPDTDEEVPHKYCGHPGFSDLLLKMRQHILGVAKRPLTHHPLSEKNWLLYASKVWDGIRKSSFFHEYSHFLP